MEFDLWALIFFSLCAWGWLFQSPCEHMGGFWLCQIVAQFRLSTWEHRVPVAI
jgi:hypothetical protein